MTYIKEISGLILCEYHVVEWPSHSQNSYLYQPKILLLNTKLSFNWYYKCYILGIFSSVTVLHQLSSLDYVTHTKHENALP